MRYEHAGKKTLFIGKDEFSNDQISLIRDSYLADMIPQLIETLRKVKSVHFEVNGPEGNMIVFDEVQKKQKEIFTKFAIELDRKLLLTKQ